MKKLILYGQHYLDKADRKAVDKVLRSNSIKLGPLIKKFKKKIVAINCDQKIFNIFDNNKNIKVILMSFTGPSYVINYFRVKSSFYD
jgi:dTDP-4-amino-4,6-dideoxygalactose transaminase